MGPILVFGRINGVHPPIFTNCSQKISSCALDWEASVQNIWRSGGRVFETIKIKDDLEERSWTIHQQ